MRKFLDKLNVLNTKSDIEMESFFIKVEVLLKNIKEDMIIAFQDKQNTFTSIAEHQKMDSNYYESFYITSKERLDTLKNILSYLLLASKTYFIRLDSQIPKSDTNFFTDDFIQTIELPYSEFVQNTHFLADLLLKEDVRAIINKNYQNTYPNARTYDIDKYVIEHLKQFKDIAPKINDFKLDNSIKTITSLQHLSMLWFKIKDGNIEKIRKSDIYIYQLCKVFL